MCMSYFTYFKQGDVIFIKSLSMEETEDSGKGTKKSIIPSDSNKGQDVQVFLRNCVNMREL